MNPQFASIRTPIPKEYMGADGFQRIGSSGMLKDVVRIPVGANAAWILCSQFSLSGDFSTTSPRILMPVDIFSNNGLLILTNAAQIAACYVQTNFGFECVQFFTGSAGSQI